VTVRSSAPQPIPDPDIRRVVALGASNLTRGLHTVVSTARAVWGPDVEVFAALGHGRSYAAPSLFLYRRLPGILESGLWKELERQPTVSTRALITDVGNDIIYGFSTEQILEWIEETITRLQRYTTDIVLTDLPAHNLQRLSNAAFLFFRSVLAPSCRLALPQVAERAVEVNAGLERIASARRLRFVRLKSEWYAFDPIHVRRSLWGPVWREILCGAPPPTAGRLRSSLFEAVRLYAMAPEQRRLLGRDQHTPQLGVRLPHGGRLWLY
jgi:hypothetical protein